MAKYPLNLCALAATLALLSFSSASGAETPRPDARHHVTGEKLDSGLGELPHYREWAHNPATRQLAAADAAIRVAGEKLDSGLGELPHYRERLAAGRKSTSLLFHYVPVAFKGPACLRPWT